MLKDWVSPWWQAALLPDRWVVCGIEVRPISVWHMFALENLQNHYICGGGCDRDDAAELLAVSRLDWESGRRLFADRSYQRRQLRDVCREIAEIKWPAVDAECVSYVAQCTRTAHAWSAKTEGTPQMAGGPCEWHLLSFLTQGNPTSLADAWNMPYAVARCLYDAYAESRGWCHLMKPEYQRMEENWPEFCDMHAEEWARQEREAEEQRAKQEAKVGA